MIPTDPMAGLKAAIKNLRPGFPDDVIGFADDTQGAAKLVERLPALLTPDDVSTEYSGGQRIWETFGIYYLQSGRYHEAALIFSRLYEQLLRYEIDKNKRCHKGVPLFWFGDCHWRLGNKVIAKRYIMLALCEDAVKHKGQLNTRDSGSYWKLVWEMGLSDEQVNEYLSEAWSVCERDEVPARFPEWILQHLDQDWMVEIPNTGESGLYIISHLYADWLLSQAGDKGGEYLERLAQYLIGAMPGCRSFRRVSTKVSEYDVVGALEGVFMDFRSELGRYLLAECKDWGRVVGFSAVAKYCRVLDSAKCRFGILFSRKGISGQRRGLYAEREILKIFQDRGVVIVVFTKDDLTSIAKGHNFLTMLRDKYEIVRLDLHGELRNRPSVRKTKLSKNPAPPPSP